MNKNNLIAFILDLKYISQYLPNNKCDAGVDHHDHENEKEHLHQHSNFKNSSQDLQKNYAPVGKCNLKNYLMITN